MGNCWQSLNPKSNQHQQDLVTIQVNRAAMAMPHHKESRIEWELVVEPPPLQPGLYVFYDTREHEHVNGDATSTNERQGIPAMEDTDDMATIRRPSSKVSPHIAPKPKPVAKIIAKTKQSSQEGMPEIIKLENDHNTMKNSTGSMAYLCSMLPRKFPELNHKEHTEPADHPESPTHATFGVNNNCLPNSLAHQGQEIPWNKGGRKAPPPPPKRTNSIKCNRNKVGQGVEISVEDSNDSQCRSASPLTCQGSPQIHLKQLHSNVMQSLSERLQSKQNVDSSVTTNRCQSPKLTYSLPLPPPQISSHVSMLASSSPGMQSTAPSSQVSSYQSSLYHVPSDSDNPLNDIIQQLEQTSGSQQAKTVTSNARHRPPPAVALKQSLKPGTLCKDMKLGDWQDDRNDSRDDSENVGSIKQRYPSNKTSIVALCWSEERGTNDPSKNLDLNASIFDDGTDTIKRNPKCTDEPKTLAPPVAPKRKDLSSSTGNAAQQNDPGNVLNGMDNMLQDLTNELDAMLELEIS